MLKTICLDAQKNDIETHPYVNFIKSFGVKKYFRLMNKLKMSIAVLLRKYKRTRTCSHCDQIKFQQKTRESWIFSRKKWVNALL